MMQTAGGSVFAYAVLDPRGFALACLSGALLGAALWWLCVFTASNWNRSYRVLPAQHLLCALAATWTFLFCVAFASATVVDGYVDRLVDEWTAAVRAEGAAGSDALAALGGFEAQHPFVRAVLGSDGAHGEAAVTVGAFQAGTTAAVDAVANTLKSQFRDRVDWAIFRLRLFLVLTFLFLQAIAFGLIGFAAHRDIRPAF